MQSQHANRSLKFAHQRQSACDHQDRLQRLSVDESGETTFNQTQGKSHQPNV